ncbi:unnamed protein product [Brassica rapa subsp. trilocularis]
MASRTCLKNKSAPSEEAKARKKGGDRCKFSHDATPETKSLPCCHFATHSYTLKPSLGSKQNAQNSGNSENLCSFGASKRDQFLII